MSQQTKEKDKILSASTKLFAFFNFVDSVGNQ